MLSAEIKQSFLDILKEELIPAKTLSALNPLALPLLDSIENL